MRHRFTDGLLPLVSIACAVLIAGCTCRGAAAADRLPALARGVAMIPMEGTPDSLPGHLNGEVFVTPASHFAYYASKGFDHVRIEGAWERLQPSLFGELGEQLLDHYDDPENPLRDPVRFVRRDLDLARENKLDVILDLCHNYGRRYVGYRRGSWAGKKPAELGSPEVPFAAFVDYTVKVVKEFGGHPAVVAVELMNEPHDLAIGEAGWREACQLAIDAIRTVDRSIAIVVNGYGWSSTEYWQERNPTLHRLRDPAGLIVWSGHIYFDKDSTGTYKGGERFAPAPGRDAIGVERLAPFTGWLRDHGFSARGHIGEFGAPDTPAWRRTVELFVGAARDAGLRLTAHMDLPYPNSDYVMSLFPRTDAAGRIVGPDRQVIELLSAGGALPPRR